MNIGLTNNMKNMYGEFNKQKVSKEDSIGGLLLDIEKERSKTEEIARKIAIGQAVDSEDIKYIREKNPALLDKANEFKNNRKVLEGKIRGAKTREEARDILNREKNSSNKLSVSEGDLGITLNLHKNIIEQAEKNTNINSKPMKEKNNKIDLLA